MIEYIKKVTAGVSAERKIALGAGVLLILVLTGALLYWTTRDNYGVLFTDLDPTDAGNIVNELERQKIPYQVDESGGTIRVPESKVHPTRLKLMSHGLVLNGAVGFEIFDKSDFGMTEYAQKINYQRALQGELARTIGSIHGIKRARVQLVLPESSIFKRDKSEPKASVSLVVDDGVQLTGEQISGIQGLVAASVPDLVPAKITVSDQRGRTISRNMDSANELPLIGGQLELKKQVEDYFTRKIVGMLDRTFGPGKAIISVDVTLNLDHVKTTEESVVPVGDESSGEIGAVVRRKSTQQMQVVASTKTNDQKEPYQVQETRPGLSTSEVEYVHGRKLEEVVATPGSIRRMSVGVIVPSDLPADELANLRDVVTMVAGIDPKRGDAIAIHAVRYSADHAANGQPATGSAKNAGAIAPPAAPAGSSFRAAGQTLSGYATPSNLAYLFAAVLLVGALVVARKRFAARERRRAEPQLTERQRVALLEEIKTWVDADTADAGMGGRK